MTFPVWGFVGGFAGSEWTILRVSPIVRTDSQLLVPRADQWSASEGVKICHSEREAERFGVQIAPPFPKEVASGELLTVAGPDYQSSLEALGVWPDYDWHFTSNGFAVANIESDEFAVWSKTVDDVLLEHFWEPSSASGSLEGENDRGRLVTLLGASKTLSRIEYFLASLHHKGATDSDLEYQLTLRLGASELGVEPVSLEKSLAIRRRAARFPIATQYRRSNPPAYRVSLRHLDSPPDESWVSVVGRGLRACREESRPFVLDFQESAGSGAPNLQALAMLSNLLVGKFRDVGLDISWPPSAARRLQLARGGLEFVLRARGETRLDRANDGNGSLALPIAPPHEDDMIGGSKSDYILYFDHPHRRVNSSSHAKYIARLARNWLRRVGMPLAYRFDRQAQQYIVWDASEALRQLLLNIRDHAALDRQVQPIEKNDTSLVQVAITRGGGRHGANRIYLLVLDTGLGIPHTVRQRLVDPNLQPTKSLQGALDGTFRRWSEDRRTGLIDVWTVCARQNALRHPSAPPARLFIASGDRDNGGCALLMSEPAEDEPIVTEYWTAPIIGTVVLMELPLRLAAKGRPFDRQMVLGLGADAASGAVRNS